MTRERGRIYILLVIGVTLLSALALVEFEFIPSSSSGIFRSSVSSSYDVASPSFQETWNLSYTNTGNVLGQVPPESLPVINVSGVFFPIGVPARLGTATTQGENTAFSLPGSGPAMPCQSNLSLVQTPYPGTSATNDTFYQAAGLQVFGPTSISLVLAGNTKWPSMGMGLLLPNTLSTLVVIQIGSGGPPSAWVSYYHYVTYANFTLAARSAPFPFNPAVPSLLTVNLASDGALSASVNGGLRLSYRLPMLNASGGPFAVVVPTLSNILGIFATSTGSFAFLAAPSSCETATLVPFVNDLPGSSLPSVPTGYRLVVPVNSSGASSGSLFLLERATPGVQPTTLLTLSNVSPITLGIGESLSFEIPWES
ncbi:MAG: hypothetical protein JRN35_10615 [Nitrososphaerota archaeon]|nr:hypothetical protein [Nitrososphaerota archaeon]